MKRTLAGVFLYCVFAGLMVWYAYVIRNTP